jgi:hypothetical protein
MSDVFLVKGIKPGKLKIDAVRLELLNELRAEGKDDEALLARTTRNWRGIKPRFETQIGLTGKDASVLVGPVGSIKAVTKWKNLDEGTGPRTIRAIRAPFLVFRLGYNRGSRPNTLDTRRPYYIGNEWRRARVVHQKGILANNWSDVVTKMRQRPYTKRMIAALNRGLEKGGWK